MGLVFIKENAETLVFYIVSSQFLKNSASLLSKIYGAQVDT